jgi:single-strand DNA-binding protein
LAVRSSRFSRSSSLNDRYGCEIIAEKVDFLSRPKSAENENPELVDRDDEIPF